MSILSFLKETLCNCCCLNKKNNRNTASYSELEERLLSNETQRESESKTRKNQQNLSLNVKEYGNSEFETSREWNSTRKESLKTLALSKKITTNIIHHNKFSSIRKLNIVGGDFIMEKKENPSIFYEKIMDLGEGSFGKVYKVRDRTSSSNIVRALKVIQKSNLKEDEIYSEGEVLKDLSHPNIIKIFDVYYYDQSIYLIEEYIEGGDLFSKLSKMDHFSEKISLYIMKQVFSAVYYLHENSLLHGDLKLENIMVHSLNVKKRPSLILSNDRFYHHIDIKLIDFGCSTLFFKDKPLTELIGTLYYLAPEVILGSYSDKCDIWSCGVILFILLTGKFPFDGDSNDEILSKISRCEYKIDLQTDFKYTSKETIDLIVKCLNPDPFNRISALEALGHKAFDCISSRSTKNRQLNMDVGMIGEETMNEVLNNIKKLNKRLVFQKAVMKYLSYNLVEQEEMNKIKRIYKLFDENNDGCISIEELILGFEEIGYLINEEEISCIVQNLDPRGTGNIEYEDFISIFIDKNKLFEEENLRKAFELFDIDKSQSISIEEIRSVFSKNNKFNEKMTEEVIRQLDIKNNDEITFEEFKNIMNRGV